MQAVSIKRLLIAGLNALAVVYLIFLLSWLLMLVFGSEEVWLLGLLNTFAIWLFLPLVAVVPWVLFQQKWFWLGALSIPIVVMLQGYGAMFLPQLPIMGMGDSSAMLKVMSFNVLISNQDYDAIAQAVRNGNPDIIGFQELRPHQVPQVWSRLYEDYPYSNFLPATDYRGIGILSRFPIQQLEQLPPPLNNRGVRAELTVENQLLQIFVAHFSPSNLDDVPFSQWQSFWQRSYGDRLQQVQQLRGLIANSNLPTLLLCDCNMTDTTQPYVRLNRSLRDSFREAGWGFGHTRYVREWIPALRVDYVWHSDDFRAIESHVGVDGGSDHRPIVATLKLKRP